MKLTNSVPYNRAAAIAPWLALFLLVVSLALSNAWFSILDDEVAILDQATAPVAHTLQLFWRGVGQHEHPPLSDILLHGWLKVAGGELWLMRFPFMIFYAAGIFLLRLCARRLGGEAAARNLLWLAVLWPFGFHFGRLAGRYTVAFFLACGLTLAYLRFLESPRKSNCLWLVVAAFALVCTNYYGWAMLACLLIDFLARHYRKGTFNTGVVGLMSVGLVLAYLPLWPAFFGEIFGVSPALTFADIVNGGFNLYSVFISESVAPWFWMVGVPVCAAIGALLMLAFRYGRADARVFLASFILLLAVMVLTGIVLTKRLLLISPWLLLPLSLVTAQTDHKQIRQVMIGLLATLAVIGWFGIFSRNYYSALHFVEPWERLAGKAKLDLDEGATVVSNSPSFFFYLTRDLACTTAGPCAAFTGVLPDKVQDPRVFDVLHWPPVARTPARVVFVRGVNINMQPQTASVQSWLDLHCQLEKRDELLPDSGYSWKHRLFPDYGQLPFRIEVGQYQCDKSAAAN